MKFYRILLLLALTLASTFSYGQIHYVNMEATSKWKQDFSGVTKINVYWDNPGLSNTTERQWVRDAIEATWSKHANIDFVGWGSYDNDGKGIRIKIDDYAHPHCKGLGNILSGMEEGMVLNFNFLGKYTCPMTREYCIKAIAIHEFGHALGIAHEQDRTDCGCDEHPRQYGGAGYYVTPCDLNSVMNYCNPNWNNGGKLSKYDIKGIQAVYGIRKTNLEGVNNNLSSISDQLGPDQVWENLYFTIGNQQFIFNINDNNKEEIKTFTFGNSGSFDYSLSSVSLHKDGKYYFGKGLGKINIDHNKSYRIDVFAKDHANTNFEIYIVATDINQQKEYFYKEDPNKITLQGLKDLGGLANTNRFLRNGQKPISLLKLNSLPNEKFYVYSDGTIMVYNTTTDALFQCATKNPPNYLSWNGKNWAWSFQRGVGNGLVETYTISTTGEVWALGTDGLMRQYGYVTYPDF